MSVPPAEALPPAIELELAPADAARLARLPMLARYRDGRPKKPTPVTTVWHDLPSAPLTASGLCLSETRGQWRLERLRPATGDSWAPAAPAPLLACAGQADELAQHWGGDTGAGPLTPVAAFNGQLREIPLRVDGAPSRLGLLEGSLRGVLANRTVCRLVLSGEPRAMARLAAELGTHVPLAVPLASLGAEAIALARNLPPLPRRLGAPEVAPGSSLSDAMAGILGHLSDVSFYWAARIVDAKGAGEDTEPVHQMRVALRRLRSALSIFRRAVHDERAWLEDLAADLKTLAAELGVARDWDVFITETAAEVQRAIPGDRRLAQMLAAATRKREEAYIRLRVLLDGSATWRQLALKLALLPTLRPWEDAEAPDQASRLIAPAAAYASAALDRRLKHLIGPGKSLEGLPHDQLHEIRKHAKRLRYAIEFFSPLFPEKAVRKYLAKLEALQEDFGTLNDTTVAASLVSGLGGGADRAFAAGLVQGFGAAGQMRAVRRVERGWSKFYGTPPFWD
jgi:CHAD domain-containing protein